MQHSIITSLTDLAQIAHVQGNVNPNAPVGAIAIFGSCVQVSVPVMVIQDTNAWLLILKPRAEDDNCALGYLFQRKPGQPWDYQHLVVTPDLRCANLSGRVENLSSLQGSSTFISDWMRPR